MKKLNTQAAPNKKLAVRSETIRTIRFLSKKDLEDGEIVGGSTVICGPTTITENQAL